MIRQRVRTDDTSNFDRLADLLGSEVEDLKGLRLLYPIVADDLKARWALAGRVGGPSMLEKGAVEVITPVWSSRRRWTVGTISFLFVWVVFTSYIRTAFGGWGVFFAVVLLVFFGMYFESRRNARRTNVDPQARACTGCSYDLSNLPDSIPPELLGGSAGPRRCPECGWAWPLVP